MTNERCVWRCRCRFETFLLTAALSLSAPALIAQQRPAPAAAASDSSAKLREYDVVSIKENKSTDGMVGMKSTPDGFSTVNMNLNNLIANAYSVRYDLISGGPGWINSKAFDVEAKVAGTEVESYKKLDEPQRSAMMQALLRERFGLKAHIETKELPVYDLVLAKGGVKLKAAAPDPPQDETHPDADLKPESKPDSKTGQPARRNGTMHMRPGEVTGAGLPMDQIASQLSYIVHHPVRNKTGLYGKYDIELKWTPEDAGPKQDNGSTDSAPSIFTAVQEQLGLKLESTKGPVETLVIDHVDLPSEN